MEVSKQAQGLVVMVRTNPVIPDAVQLLGGRFFFVHWKPLISLSKAVLAH